MLEEIVEKSREGCFFCPEQVEKSSPQYPKELIPEGRLHGIEACVFPNMIALSKFNAVIALTKQHYLRLDEYSPSILQDGFTAALQFIKRVYETDPTAEYAAIGCNYLFPAGATIIHPHFQVLVDKIPSNYVKGLLDYSKQYFDENSTCYWSDLLEAEKREKERYIGRTGNIDWFAPFAPSGSHEIQAVVRDRSNFIEFGEEDMRALAEGLSKVLKCYKGWRVGGFNFIIYSAPLGKRSKYFLSGLKIISRGYFPPQYVSDVNWRHKLLLRGCWLQDTPEAIASVLREAF